MTFGAAVRERERILIGRLLMIGVGRRKVACRQ
jgi:hypothetical protein